MIDYSNQYLILDKKFLSQEQCLDIKDKIFSIRDRWQTCQVENFNFLPLGLYSVPFAVYKTNVPKFKILMLDLFGRYYNKIQSFIENVFDLKVNFHKNFNYPGFHIANKSICNTNFHRDQFSNLFFLSNGLERLNQKSPKIFSFIIPISIPQDGSGLLIRMKPRETQQRHLQDYDVVLNYDTGILAMWDGQLEHSVKPFKIFSDNEFRITMQFHMALTNKQGYLFW